MTLEYRARLHAVAQGTLSPEDLLRWQYTVTDMPTSVYERTLDHILRGGDLAPGELILPTGDDEVREWVKENCQ